MIFVQITSYRDPELIPTLTDLFKQASRPEQIRVCVSWTHGPEDTLNIFKDLPQKQLDIIDLQWQEAKGISSARNTIQQRYQGEAYTMHLDSHHRFVAGWDVKCINAIEELRAKSPKPGLTAYLPSFNPLNDPQERELHPWKMEFDEFSGMGIALSKPLPFSEAELLEPLRAKFYSGHFCFVDGSFCTEVQHDPEYFYLGEEISIAARAFTHGYDLYYPNFLIAWHEYTRMNRPLMWNEHPDWWKLDRHCAERNKRLFGIGQERQDLGKYGFGKERTLEQYETLLGQTIQGWKSSDSS
jgi:hypothetical protein